jgi:hypothetical protein
VREPFTLQGLAFIGEHGENMEKELKAAKEVLAKHTGGDVLTIEESRILFDYCHKADCQNCELKKEYGGKCPIIIAINE